MCTLNAVHQGIEWWEGAAGALLGALIGSCVPLLWAWWTRRAERRGELVAMQEEMYHAYRAMTALRSAGVLAPLYHLPLTTFERALPKLIGEGLLKRDEIDALTEYVMRAEELNRGLDLAVSVVAAKGEQGAHAAASEQWNRNVGKVSHILDERQDRLGGRTVYIAAQQAIFRLARSAGVVSSPNEGIVP